MHIRVFISSNRPQKLSQKHKILYKKRNEYVVTGFPVLPLPTIVNLASKWSDDVYYRQITDSIHPQLFLAVVAEGKAWMGNRNSPNCFSEALAQYPRALYKLVIGSAA